MGYSMQSTQTHRGAGMWAWASSACRHWGAQVSQGAESTGTCARKHSCYEKMAGKDVAWKDVTSGTKSGWEYKRNRLVGVHSGDWRAQSTFIRSYKKVPTHAWCKVGQGDHISLLWSRHLEPTIQPYPWCPFVAPPLIVVRLPGGWFWRYKDYSQNNAFSELFSAIISKVWDTVLSYCTCEWTTVTPSMAQGQLPNSKHVKWSFHLHGN